MEYTEQTVKLMVPMLKFYFHDGVRAAAAESLPCLIECAKIRGPQYVQEMWAYICPELLKAIEAEPETSLVSEHLNSMARLVIIHINNMVFQSAKLHHELFIIHPR